LLVLVGVGAKFHGFWSSPAQHLRSYEQDSACLDFSKSQHFSSCWSDGQHQFVIQVPVVRFPAFLCALLLSLCGILLLVKVGIVFDLSDKKFEVF
jgi:hypothetical protein